MRWSLGLALLFLVSFAPYAGAYDYPLQFTPNPGYRELVVAGYAFEGPGVVVGTCSYYTESGRTGRGGAGRGVIKRYDQTCRWDLYGNLLSVTPGAPDIPFPLLIKDDQTVYAANENGSYTGTSKKQPQEGFVSTPGPHYTWVTPNADSVIQDFPNNVYTYVVTLQSDGDVPVTISSLAVKALHGAAKLRTTDCLGQIEAGATCAVTLTFDVSAGGAVNGLAYDTLRVELTSDAGAPADFIQNFTILLPVKL